MEQSSRRIRHVEQWEIEVSSSRYGDTRKKAAKGTCPVRREHNYVLSRLVIVRCSPLEIGYRPSGKMVACISEGYFKSTQVCVGSMGLCTVRGSVQ